MRSIKLIAIILSILYMAFGVVSLYNWIVEISPINATKLENVFSLYVPSDVGYAVLMLTTGTLLLYSVLSRDNIQSISSLFIGSLLACGGMLIQILVAVANYADAYIATLAGEELSLTILIDLLRPEVIIGIPCIALLITSISNIKKLTSHGE